jgi:hypothetical protein
MSITGAENSTSSGIWDKGTATITYSGTTITVSYGQFSTPASVASGIAAGFANIQCSSGVAAKAVGPEIIFSSTAQGAPQAPSFSTVYDSTDFSQPSFSAATQPTSNIAPYIMEIIPSGSVRVGTAVTVIGAGFGVQQGHLAIGGQSITSVLTWTDNQIVFQVPNVPSGAIQVQSSSGLVSATYALVVLPSASITSISLGQGPPGMGVVLTGPGFGDQTESSEVTINGVPATIVTWSDSSITIQIPSGATSGPVEVLPFGTLTSQPVTGQSFVVTAPLQNCQQ